MKNEVVIMDLNYRMVMPAIWSLSNEKVEITGVCYSDIKKSKRLGFYSNKLKYKKIVVNPKIDESLFLEQMIKISEEIYKRTCLKPVLVVVSSISMQFITKNIELFKKHYLMNVVDENTYYMANNTLTLGEIANSINVSFPKTVVLSQYDDINLLANSITYPVVIKYQLGEKLTISANERYHISENREDFVENYIRMNSIQSDPLVQEYVRGNGYGVSVVMDENSNIVEIYSHKRIRELPISGGPSTLCEPVWNENMVKEAVKLLKQLKWSGYAMVEFKGNSDYDFKLMEINPRFWGSMVASYNSGINMASSYFYSLVESKSDEFIECRYKIGKNGIKTQFLIQDLVASIKYSVKYRHIKYSMDFIKDCLDKNTKSGLFRLDDIKPFFYYILGLFIS